MHTLYILAFATFAIVMGVGVWSYISTRENQKTGGHTTGLGGPNDPMA